MAVLAASVAALLALLWHVPVRVACLRGGIAWLGVILVGKVVGMILQQVGKLDEQRARAQLATDVASNLDGDPQAEPKGGKA